MKIIAIIPARSGSKGIVNKNIRKVGNKTLIERAIQVARDANIKDIFISTDSAAYEKIALSLGAKSIGLRPAHLSSDTAKICDVVINLLDNLKCDNYFFDAVLLLQPTSPQRHCSEIFELQKTLRQTHADAVVSLAKLEEPHPYKLKKIQNGRVVPFLEKTDSEISRQELPVLYKLTGAYYLVKTQALYEEKTFLPKNTVPLITKDVVNIDTEKDVLFAEFLYQKGIL